uniref:Uncharacterized protein n=1 Tax=Picea glauca TaxID=3330 RepID=A0A124GP88_PICGL|nr:hypothetical protein ABT39_MTgene1064 [Picea glauca]
MGAIYRALTMTLSPILCIPMHASSKGPHSKQQHRVLMKPPPGGTDIFIPSLIARYSI